ncbi:hypothetical protein [Kitasatospora sp. DSM 101779]|uniref:hypothetical protein n=1 Tax=Kitasatospora sp. DSM 101779 TaxID=2853165 RepID=UPI0021D888E2|nr:hypothetical protein [Kitasatospora sp. DSM 101779]MCU7824484.1 hypothetical protein [Kitasatospora sp. DSM 101779]
MSETSPAADPAAGSTAASGEATPVDEVREPARVVGMPLVARCAGGPFFGVLSVLHTTSATSPTWFGGVVAPLGGALMALLVLSRELTWQIGQDRDGLVLTSALRVRRRSWDEVKRATARGSTLTVRFKDGQQVSVRTWSTRVDGVRLNPGGFAVFMAGVVSASAASPQRRPAEVLPASAVGRPQVLLNRLSLAALVLITLGRYFL